MALVELFNHTISFTTRPGSTRGLPKATRNSSQLGSNPGRSCDSRAFCRWITVPPIKTFLKNKTTSDWRPHVVFPMMVEAPLSTPLRFQLKESYGETICISTVALTEKGTPSGYLSCSSVGKNPSRMSCIQDWVVRSEKGRNGPANMTIPLAYSVNGTASGICGDIHCKRVALHHTSLSYDSSSYITWRLLVFNRVCNLLSRCNIRPRVQPGLACTTVEAYCLDARCTCYCRHVTVNKKVDLSIAWQIALT